MGNTSEEKYSKWECSAIYPYIKNKEMMKKYVIIIEVDRDRCIIFDIFQYFWSQVRRKNFENFLWSYEILYTISIDLPWNFFTNSGDARISLPLVDFALAQKRLQKCVTGNQGWVHFKSSFKSLEPSFILTQNIRNLRVCAKCEQFWKWILVGYLRKETMSYLRYSSQGFIRLFKQNSSKCSSMCSPLPAAIRRSNNSVPPPPPGCAGSISRAAVGDK